MSKEKQINFFPVEVKTKENCADCKYHDVFWEGAGCILLNNMEKCKFAPKGQSDTGHQTEKGGEG